MLGAKLDRFVHPEDAAALKPLLQDADGGSVIVENWYRHKDGSYCWFQWAVVVADNVIYASGRHITADKKARVALQNAEERLRQSQKVEAIGQLTGGVAHDLNNLLAVIHGSVDLLRRPDVSEERRLRYIDAIADAADRATKLTGQLLAFARRQSLKPEVFDTSERVRAISDMVRTLTGLRMKVAVPLAEEPCYIDADRSQFDTAIVNMRVNPRDAMHGEGELTIAVGATPCVPSIRTHPAVTG